MFYCKRNICGWIIPTPQGFMLCGSVIQALSFFRLIIDIVSCQALIKTKGLLAYSMEDETLKAYWLLNILQLSLS